MCVGGTYVMASCYVEVSGSVEMKFRLVSDRATRDPLFVTVGRARHGRILCTSRALGHDRRTGPPMASTRFRALATTAVAALALCTACSSDSSGSSDASSADKPLKLAVFASLNGVPAFAADEEGVFGKHGLDVEIGTAKTSTEMVPQLLGGKVNLALLDTATSLVAAGQGVDLVYVAAATDGGIPEGQEDFSF